MPNPVIEHVYVEDTTYDVKDIYAERIANKTSSFADNESDDRYPSALLVKTELAKKADSNAVVTEFSSTTSDTKIPSEKLVKTSLDTKEDVSNKLTSSAGWHGTPTDVAYPSEKLVKESIDVKEDSANKTSAWSDNPGNTKFPTEKLVYDGLQAQRTIVVNSLPDVANAVATCDYILKNGTSGVLYKVIDGAWAPVGASNAQVLNALPASGDVYTDYYVQNSDGVYIHYRWAAGNVGFYEVGADAYSKTQSDNKYEVLANKVTAFQITPTDTAYPSEKLVYDSLDDLRTALEESTVIVSALPEVSAADEHTNYILTQGAGALLYRVINNAWRMVGGAMVSVLSALPASGDEFTDYYVATENSNIYLHYRWVDTVGSVEGHFYAVGADAYSKAEVDNMFTLDRARLSTLEGDLSTLDGEVDTLQAQIVGFSSMVDNVEAPQDGSGGIIVTYQNGTSSTVPTYDVRKRVEEVNSTATGIQVVYTDGTSEDIEISGGGGGSSDTGSATITRVTAADATCVYGEDFNIQYRFEATDSAGDQVGSGTATWFVDNVRKGTSTALQNAVNSFNIGPYLSVGSNTVKVSISVDTGGDTQLTRTKTWTVNAVNMYVVWDYDETTINTADQISIRWTPYGNVSKTTYIVFDGNTSGAITSTTSRSGVQQYVTVNKLAHGSHNVEMYCKATINGTEITSPSVYHAMIFADTENQTPIVACSVASATVTQYNTITLPITIYTPGSLTSDATLAVDGVTTAEWTNVDRTQHEWNYTPSTAGTKVLTVTSGTAVATIRITVEELDIDNEEISGYAFKLKASDLAGNDALRAWSSNGVDATFSGNFDWNNGGIKTETDESGNPRQFVCVKAGTTMTINYELFGNDAKVSGKNFKIIFKATNSRDYDAVFLDCLSDGIGIQLGANGGTARSEQNTVNVQYAEESYTEFEYDVYPDSGFRYMQTFIDGVLSSTNIYAAGDNFTQITKKKIVIGSADCDVYIYMIKAYETALSLENHIENFIADAPNATEMVERFNRNDVLNDSGEISYTKLSQQNPNCRIHLWDIPRMSTNKMKNDPVTGCSYQQIYLAGDAGDQITAENVTIGVQGTSSINYISSAANTDGNFTEGFTDGNGNHLNGYAMTENSIPVSYFNTKVNVASCENINNMCLAEWYNRFQPYRTGARANVTNARDCMEHHIGVQFIRDRSGSLFHSDDPNGENYHMYAIVNMGNSKNNGEVFHDANNPLECCFETKDNNSAVCMMTAPLTEEALDTEDFFEFRYPTNKSARTSAMKQAFINFCNWMCSCNPAAATNATLSSPVTYGPYTFRGTSSWDTNEQTEILTGLTISDYAGTYTTDSYEYRMAKMLNECEDHLVMDSIVYHYVFIEHHAMVDNVCKNTFWGTDDQIHWHLCKNYDNDTADGNDNTGHLTIPFGSEGMDTLGTGDVFNGKMSIYWQFVYGLYPARRLMWQNRENAGAWDASAYLEFATGNQNYLPERVYNQDYWYKYLRPYEQNNDTTYIAMLEGGKKTHQREAFVYNNMWYMASQYTGSMCLSDSITLRGYTPAVSASNTEEVNAKIRATIAAVPPKAEVQVMLYNKGYVIVEIGSVLERVKAEKGVYYTIDFSATSGAMNDTVINVHAARNVRALGNLAPLYIGTSNFSKAAKLRTVYVGSNESGYWNGNIDPEHPVTFGANTMLEEVYIQNCPNATYTLDLSACQALSTIDARGSGFTGMVFAVGGLLDTAYLPSPSALTMRGLANLYDANFTLESYNNLTTLRFEDTPNVSSLNLINSAVNLSRLRLLDIDWTIAETTLLNRLLGLMGIDESDHNTDVSVLSGTVFVSGTIRSAELESYADAWENLDVTYNPDRLIRQYNIYYRNDDGTLLLTYPVDVGTLPPNPVTAGFLDAPSKASDAQYVYTYSGWDDLNTVVTESRSVYAVYTTTLRTYTVTWYEQEGDTVALDTANVGYGSVASFSGTLPTAKTNDSTGMYQVFTGWDKSTGCVRGNINVYGLWDSATYPSETKELNELTPAEIYAVSVQKRGASRYAAKDYFMLEHGHDFDFSNVESQLLLEDRFFDGSTYYDTNVQLFNGNSKSFTLAIDYEYLVTSPTRGSLASCIEPNSGEGFSLSFRNSSTPSSSYPYIDWTNGESLRCGLSGQRNIIVLRYVQGSSNLTVYSFNGTSSSDISMYDTYTTVIPCTGTSAPNIDNYLAFGAIRHIENGSVVHTNYATGWIHWAKVWFDDLGDENCRLLASWPHEKTKMEYGGAERQMLSTSNYVYADSSFYANNLLPLLFTYSSSDYVTVTWEGSQLQNFFEERIFNGLPYKWQSIIKPVKILTNQKNGTKKTNTSINHLYPPAYNEVYNITTSSQYETESDGFVEGLFGTTTSSFSLCHRWAGVAVEDRASNTAGRRVIVMNDDPTYNSGYVCQDGDIWFRATAPRTWMYISAATAAQHSIIGTRLLYDDADSSNILEAYDGGYWIRCESWWTRSPDENQNANFRVRYYYGDYFTYLGYSTRNGILIGLSI